MAKTFEETIKEIQDNYLFHRKEAENYRMLLEAAGVDTSDKKKNLHKTMLEQTPFSKNGSGKSTFESEIIGILKKDGRLISTKDLQKKYETYIGKSLLGKNFSSKLSIASKNNKIKNIKFEEFPVDERYYWGLIEWYNGDKPKEEFVKKVYDRADVKA